MSELQQVNREIDNYKIQVAQAELLERLSSNKDFQSLILNDFLRENAIRLVELKAHPNQQTSEKQAAIMRQMDGVGALRDYLRAIRQNGETAANSLISAEEMRIQLISEQ